ncbi:MAG: hypothetical protein ACOYEO_08535 [bacterium]
MKVGLIRRLIRLLFDPRVKGYKKKLFLIVVILYWLLPDLMPFVPLDDILVTLLGSWLFVHSAKKDVPPGSAQDQGRPGTASTDYIDIEGYVVDEDDKPR